MKNTCSPTRKLNGNTIGVDLSMDDADMLEDVTRNIVSSKEEIEENVEEIDASTEALFNAISSLKYSCIKVINNVENAGVILNFLNELSTETDLIDSNGIIKTTRIGQQDREFAIVTDKIREISITRAVLILGNLLKSIRYKFDKILNEMDNLSEQTLLQAIATDQVALWLTRLSRSTEQLSKISEKTIRVNTNSINKLA